MELTPADKEKLSSSVKVARKLEKLASKVESSSESNESNPPSLDTTTMTTGTTSHPLDFITGERAGSDISKLNLDSLDAMVTYLISSDASTQTVITMEHLNRLDPALLPEV